MVIATEHLERLSLLEPLLESVISLLKCDISHKKIGAQLSESLAAIRLTNGDLSGAVEILRESIWTWPRLRTLLELAKLDPTDICAKMDVFLKLLPTATTKTEVDASIDLVTLWFRADDIYTFSRMEDYLSCTDGKLKLAERFLASWFELCLSKQPFEHIWRSAQHVLGLAGKKKFLIASLRQVLEGETLDGRDPTPLLRILEKDSSLKTDAKFAFILRKTVATCMLRQNRVEEADDILLACDDVLEDSNEYFSMLSMRIQICINLDKIEAAKEYVDRFLETTHHDRHAPHFTRILRTLTAKKRNDLVTLVLEHCRANLDAECFKSIGIPKLALLRCCLRSLQKASAGFSDLIAVLDGVLLLLEESNNSVRTELEWFWRLTWNLALDFASDRAKCLALLQRCEKFTQKVSGAEILQLQLHCMILTVKMEMGFNDNEIATYVNRFDQCWNIIRHSSVPSRLVSVVSKLAFDFNVHVSKWNALQPTIKENVTDQEFVMYAIGTLFASPCPRRVSRECIESVIDNWLEDYQTHIADLGMLYRLLVSLTPPLERPDVFERIRPLACQNVRADFYSSDSHEW